MLQVRDGAGETLGVLFERYHAPLYNFYTKLTGDRALSEDPPAASANMLLGDAARPSHRSPDLFHSL